MEKENKSAVEAVSEIIANAVGDDNFVLPLAAWQTQNPSSDEINATYCKEIDAYRASPVGPCDKTTSLKKLKRLARKNFHEFWTASVTEYLPAVTEGTMKLCERIYPHDEAICYAKGLIAVFSPKDLAKDFLYGVAHNAPEYRTVLACYYYIKNLPEHEFQKKYVGSVVGKDGEFEDRYNETGCEICGYQHSLSSEPKMQFWHINMNMASFYFDGRMERSNLNTAILYLEEYKKLPRPRHSPKDYGHFMRIIEVIENTPQNMTSEKLRSELKKSGLLQMTVNQIECFIDMLGYLDILHSDDSHGMLYTHTPERDMLYPLSERGYTAHPVNRWTRKCGVDFQSISLLFDGIYD